MSERPDKWGEAIAEAKHMVEAHYPSHREYKVARAFLDLAQSKPFKECYGCSSPTACEQRQYCPVSATAFNHAARLYGHIAWLRSAYPDAETIPAELEEIAKYLSTLSHVASFKPCAKCVVPKDCEKNGCFPPANEQHSEPYLHPILAAQRGTPAYEAEKAALSSTRALVVLHDKLGSMIDQIGQPDYSLRELVIGLREVRDELMRHSTPSAIASSECDRIDGLCPTPIKCKYCGKACR